MPKANLSSWGRVIQDEYEVVSLRERQAPLPAPGEPALSMLAYGNGRSYGDSCLNRGGLMLDARGLDRFLDFDTDTGVLRCEAGVLLAEILALCVPQGWFLPVTPGTRFVTVGGAIANDVHGKNHHRAGNFGAHVRQFELVRSDGSRIVCTPHKHRPWFEASVGGLGLTGLITWAEIQLRPIPNPWVATETLKFGALEEFFDIAQSSDGDFEYTVAWIDCLARGKSLGRGLFMRGNHAPEGTVGPAQPSRALGVPLTPGPSLVNGLSLRAFNTMYYHKQRAALREATTHYEPFFYPLDGIRDWNRIYGVRGFFQYQSVVPVAAAHDATAAMLEAIAQSGMGSFLAVLKVFGDVPGTGMLSFPMPGVTLALDFPNDGAAVRALFARLDAIVREAGGRLYPAKDALMSAAMFQAGYPRWRDFAAFVDPGFSSNFWRRVARPAPTDGIDG